MSRGRPFFLSVFVVFMPFLFAVNIIRTQARGNKDNLLLTSTALEYISEVDFSFAGTYYSISKTADSWTALSSSNSFWDGLKNFGSALGATFELPFRVVGDLFGIIQDCCQLFIKLVGFMPGYDSSQPSQPSQPSFPGSGSPGGGGGGGGSRPAT